MTESSRQARQQHQQQWNWLTIAFRAQTYRNILYLFASFPLGTFYFFSLIIGLASGLGSVIAGIGIPILALCVVAWWWMAASLPPDPRCYNGISTSSSGACCCAP